MVTGVLQTLGMLVLKSAFAPEEIFTNWLFESVFKQPLLLITRKVTL